MAKDRLVHKASRREFVKKAAKAAYVAPVILSLQAAPSFAKRGSDDQGEDEQRRLSGTK
jgi:hypothetical protein